MDEIYRAQVRGFLRVQPDFEEVPAKDLDRFVNACRLVSAGAGDVILRQGEYGETLFFVLNGSVLVRLKRGSGEETVLALLRRGDIFGELTVLGQRPRSATVVANEAVELLECDREDIGRLLKASPRLLGRFDRLYRRRAVAANIYADPLFASLPPAALERLIDRCRMRSFDKDEPVVREGDPGEAFYIVWTGQLRVCTRIDGAERVFAYLHEGDYFGEAALVERTLRTASVVANERAQVIEVRREEFEAMVAADRQILDRILAGIREREKQARAMRARPDKMLFIEDMMKMGALHATSALLINLDVCVACGNCAAACQHRYGNSRLVRRGKTYVLPDSGARVLMPNSCWHCRDPECMVGCPTDALRRLPTGEIQILEERCIGCEICANQCPWGNITMAPAPGEPKTALGRLYRSIREALRSGRETGGAADRVSPRRVAGKAVKCDLCAGAGGEPACIAACPYGAIDHVNPNRVLSDAVDA